MENPKGRRDSSCFTEMLLFEAYSRFSEENACREKSRSVFAPPKYRGGAVVTD